ncbi:MAG: 4'-phosphopantetheinyl transferase superfamily protein [Clostridia bacterium]|nr:4'-phosphopantetheinyl transferase superfamily protein [Clostridia bacterium]
MGKIFYTDKTDLPSLTFVKRVLALEYGIQTPTILRTKNGKPYLATGEVYFSVSHTSEKLFLAFSKKPVGLDAELRTREIDYSAILKKFTKQETLEIENTVDFLKHWVVKESVIKYIGGTLARDLKKIEYLHGEVFYKKAPLQAQIYTRTACGHLLAICGEEDFEKVEIFPLTV